MCKYCDYDSPENIVFKDCLTNEDYLNYETSIWDEHLDGWNCEKIYISYCPWCGRKLNKKD